VSARDLSALPAVLARLEREYGRARVLTGLAAIVTGECIGAPAGAVLVDCRVVAVTQGVEVLYDIKAPRR
jgi:hypothetical protein